MSAGAVAAAVRRADTRARRDERLHDDTSTATALLFAARGCELAGRRGWAAGQRRGSGTHLDKESARADNDTIGVRESQIGRQ